jgi:hypothetical protein
MLNLPESFNQFLSPEECAQIDQTLLPTRDRPLIEQRKPISSEAFYRWTKLWSGLFRDIERSI